MGRLILQLLVLFLCFGSKGGESEKAKPGKKAEENDEIFNGKPASTRNWIDPDNMVEDSRFYHSSIIPEEEARYVSAFRTIQEQLLNCEGQLRHYEGQLRASYWTYIKEKFDIFTLLLTAMLLGVVIGVVEFERRTCVAIHQQLYYLFMVAFIVNVPWEWFRLYNKEFGRKRDLMKENITKHCHTVVELSITQLLRLWGKRLFSVEESTCSKYQEALLIDPLLEVSPLKAVSITITTFIQPFELFADGTGKSFCALFLHLLVITLLACLIIILCPILFSRIRISTPFLHNGHARRLEQQRRGLTEQNAAAIQNLQPAAVQDIADDDRNQHNVPVMAEAAEDTDSELEDIGVPQQEEASIKLQRPVQVSEHYPTEPQ